MDERYAPVSTLGFLGIILLSLIPLLGPVVLLIWSFGGCKRINKRNYARAALAVSVACTVMLVGAGSVLRPYINPAVFGGVINTGGADSKEGSTAISSDDIIAALSQNPQMVSLLLKNPDVVKEITNLLSRPEVMSAVISNPEIINQMAGNVEIQNAFLSNPDVISSFVNNPEIINLMASNPGIQKAFLNNPDVISSVLSNPEVVSAILTPEVISELINSGALGGVVGSLFGR